MCNNKVLSESIFGARFRASGGGMWGEGSWLCKFSGTAKKTWLFSNFDVFYSSFHEIVLFTVQFMLNPIPGRKKDYERLRKICFHGHTIHKFIKHSQNYTMKLT